MSTNTKPTALELANTFSTYFVEDFASNVMNHLRGSHAIPADVLTSVIKNKVEEMTSGKIEIANNDVVGRFLYECANYALESNIPNVSSRAAWDQVSALPSVHHQEINTIIFASADLYHTTVDQSVIGTIAKDADMTARLITQTAQARTQDSETGGTFNLFSWGILNDGLWLNAALMRANDRASIFKPDHVPVVSWAQQAFNFAHQTASLTSLDKNERLHASAELNLLISHAPKEMMDALLGTFSQAQLNDLLFSSGKLASYVNAWDKGRANAKDLILSVSEMSAVARLLQLLNQAAVTQEDDAISSSVRDRLNRANETVTMALVGYEVMRETRFSDTLIMSVVAEGNDPKVDVFVNGDTITNYRATSGSDVDLVNFAHHLDPRRGMPPSSTGWSMEYVTSRRDNVLNQVATESFDRLERMRANDADVIRNETQRITRNVVQSYLMARDIDTMPPALHQAIGRFSRDVVDSKTTVRLDEELTTMLATAQGDPFVQKATKTFVDYLNGEGNYNQYAKAATVASLAVQDAVELISGTQEA